MPVCLVFRSATVTRLERRLRQLREQILFARGERAAAILRARERLTVQGTRTYTQAQIQNGAF